MSILGILGISGLGIGAVGIGMAIFAPGLLANIAKSVVGFLSAIPPKGWIAIGVGAALILGFFLHQSKAHKALAAEYARGASDEDAKWQKRLDAEHKAAMDWKAKADSASSKITDEERARHEAERDAIAARADDQRVRGPGKAAAAPCGRSSGPAGLPASPGGSVSGGSAVDASLAGLSQGQGLAVVPWDDLTTFAASHDAAVAENRTWRSWYAREAKHWADVKAAPPKP
jgi:hypothetical protein